jgi:glycosyltransferase involved in cell wall biosynthesis
MARIETQRLGLNDIEILFDTDGHATIGAKRNNLLQRAAGRYSVFIDDDDLIHEQYLNQILCLCEFNRDSIGFYVQYYEDGKRRETGKLSAQCYTYTQLPSPIGEPMYVCPPSPRCPIKTEIAQKVLFADSSHGEDIGWALKLRQHIRYEMFCPYYLYHYFFRNKKSATETEAELDAREIIVDDGPLAPPWENVQHYHADIEMMTRCLVSEDKELAKWYEQDLDCPELDKMFEELRTLAHANRWRQ